METHVRNAKDAAEAPALESHGFALLVDDAHNGATEHEWLRDEKHILENYYREAEAMAMDIGRCRGEQLSILTGRFPGHVSYSPFPADFWAIQLSGQGQNPGL